MTREKSKKGKRRKKTQHYNTYCRWCDKILILAEDQVKGIHKICEYWEREDINE